MGFDMLEFMKSGGPEEGHEPTELQEYEAERGFRGKGIEHKVSPEEKEHAQKILGQLYEAKEVLDRDEKEHMFADNYDVFEHAEKTLANFYIKEAHMSPRQAETVAKKMAAVYQIIESVDDLIYTEEGNYTQAGVRPDHKGIWEDVIKKIRRRLEVTGLSPAKVEVILDDLYKQKAEWVWEPQKQVKPSPKTSLQYENEQDFFLD